MFPVVSTLLSCLGPCGSEEAELRTNTKQGFVSKDSVTCRCSLSTELRLMLGSSQGMRYLYGVRSCDWRDLCSPEQAG